MWFVTYAPAEVIKATMLFAPCLAVCFASLGRWRLKDCAHRVGWAPIRYADRAWCFRNRRSLARRAANNVHRNRFVRTCCHHGRWSQPVSLLTRVQRTLKFRRHHCGKQIALGSDSCSANKNNACRRVVNGSDGRRRFLNKHYFRPPTSSLFDTYNTELLHVCIGKTPWMVFLDFVHVWVGFILNRSDIPNLHNPLHRDPCLYERTNDVATVRLSTMQNGHNALSNRNLRTTWSIAFAFMRLPLMTETKNLVQSVHDNKTQHTAQRMFSFLSHRIKHAPSLHHGPRRI